MAKYVRFIGASHSRKEGWSMAERIWLADGERVVTAVTDGEMGGQAIVVIEGDENSASSKSLPAEGRDGLS